MWRATGPDSAKRVSAGSGAASSDERRHDDLGLHSRPSTQSPTQRLFITGPRPHPRRPPPYRRRLYWTPPFAGCDSDNLLCGSGSACEAAVALRHHHCTSLHCPTRRITRRQHSYSSLVARPQARYSFNVRGRALSQTPASLVQPAVSGARSSKVCLCCAAPAHTAAFGPHVTYMERAVFIAPARRRHFPDTTKHIWLPRTHDWKGIE